MSQNHPESYEAQHAEKTYPLLSDKQYDLLKRFQIILLPGLVSFYLVIAEVANIGGGDKVAKVGAALGVFIGVVLLFAGKSYTKAVETGTALDGSMEVVETPEGEPDKFVATFTSSPDEIKSKSTLNLRVNKR